MIKLHIVIPHRQDEPHLQECLASVVPQLCEGDQIHDASDVEGRGALYNIWRCAKDISDGVVVQLDGDDKLLPNALDTIRSIFANSQIWVMHANYVRSDNGKPWATGRYDNSDFRNQPCLVAGLRAWRAELLPKIEEEDLKIGGHWQVSGWDNALMLPMLEMSGLERVHYENTPLSLYRIHDANDRHHRVFQEFSSWYSRKRKRYTRLENLNDTPTREPHTPSNALLLVDDEPFSIPKDQISTLITGRPNLPSFVISTPMYGGEAKEPYVTSLMKTIAFFERIGFRFGEDFDVHRIGTESLIPRARNLLAHNFRNTHYRKLIFIDADVGFEPEDVLRLLTANVDVVAGAYPVKSINWDSVLDAHNRGFSEPEKYASRVVVNHVANGKGAVTSVSNSLIEVHDAATGFLCIDRSVFDRMESPELAYIDDGPRPAGTPPVTIYDFFFSGRMEDYVDGKPAVRYLSEDYGFCRLWQKMGGKIYLHMDIELTHTGSFTFRGTPSQLAQESGVLKFKPEDMADARAILENGIAVSNAKMVVDLDSVCGASAIVIGKMNPDVEIVCVEPRPDYRSMLEHNLVAARVRNAKIVDSLPAIDPSATLILRRGQPCAL